MDILLGIFPPSVGPVAWGVFFLATCLFLAGWPYSCRLQAAFDRVVISRRLSGGGRLVDGHIGLVDNPAVSQYRLASHLGVALIIFSALIWTASNLQFGQVRWPVGIVWRP